MNNMMNSQQVMTPIRANGNQLVHSLWGNLPKSENSQAEYHSKQAREDLKTILDLQVQ